MTYQSGNAAWPVQWIILGFCLLAGPSVWSQGLEKLKKELGLEYMPDIFDYPESDAVIILESHDIDVDFDTNFRLSTYEDVRIVKKIFKNFDEQASVELFIPSGMKLEKIEGRTIPPTGKPISLGKKDFYTITGNSDNTVFYSDEKTVKFTFKSIEKDAIVDYHYRVRNDHPFEQDIWWIQGELPKLQNSYTLHIPKVLFDDLNWNWLYKVYNYAVGPPNAVVAISGPTMHQKNLYEWNLKNIPAFHTERLMPPFRNHIGYVKFAPNDWKSYDDIARSYNQYNFQPRLVLTDDVRKKALDLTNLCTTDSQRVEKLYDYVRGFRYIAIDLDRGGITPSLPQDVLVRQYGDCKDKATLLIGMLRSLKIKAYPALVMTANQGLVDTDFPNWSFNHMIVKADVANTAIWMDPTAETYAFGKLPWTDEGVNTLVVYADGSGRLESTARTKFDQNVTDVNIEFQNTSATDVKYTVGITYTGESEYDHQFTFKDKTYNDLRKFCQSVIIDDYLGAKLDTVILTKPGASGQPLKLQFSFTAPGAIQKQADLYFVNADPYKLIEQWSWLIHDTRQYPIDFRYAQMVHKKVTAKLNGNLILRNLPGNANLNTAGMSYTRNFTALGQNGWECEEIFALKDYFIWPYEYKDAKAFFQKMKASIEEKTILTNKN